jgi:hypothetical protein
LDAIQQSSDPGRLVPEPGLHLAYAGNAAKGRVEIRDTLDRYLNWGIRLRVGDELVARLKLYNDGDAWVLKSGSAGTQLRQQGAKTDESVRGTTYQVFTFKAVEKGTTDLVFDYRLRSGSGAPNSNRVVVD